MVFIVVGGGGGLVMGWCVWSKRGSGGGGCLVRGGLIGLPL